MSVSNSIVKDKSEPTKKAANPKVEDNQINLIVDVSHTE